MKQECLLTIAIPTYNRINDLKISLGSILSQIAESGYAGGDIEVVISDNASVDGTYDYVQTISAANRLVYHRNEKNLGADANMSLCYKYGSGRFLWIFADDDLLIDGALKKIVELLRENPTVGNCYINSAWLHNPLSYDGKISSELSYSIHSSKEQFDRVGYWITFLTGNIINKELLGDSILDALPAGTSLIQLGWVVPAIFSSDKNIYISDILICCRSREDRGYKIIPIFCTNLIKVLRDFESRKIGVNLVKSVSPKLLSRFLYDEIDNVARNNEEVVMPMIKEFWNRKFLWGTFFPSYVIKKIKLYLT